MAYQSRILMGATFQGRYRILSELGRGGFGVVYKAHQLATGQAVAVKVLCLDSFAVSSWERQIARFRREMRLCGRLHHPNIVRLIDSGQADDACVYTVFELVPGKTLARVLAEEGALEPAEARHLMIEILDALSCAHAQGVVHRDLKPTNIMVVATGARRNAMILDFGIGALTEEKPIDGWSSLTPTNEALGSPGYAAPEQLRCQRPTPRSDLFSWGLVFLESLTGRRVFDGPLPVVLRQQLSFDPVAMPPALSAHPLGQILRRATNKAIEARSGSAAELLRELEACDLGGLSRSTLAGAASGASDALTLEGDGGARTGGFPATVPLSKRPGSHGASSGPTPEPAPGSGGETPSSRRRAARADATQRSGR